MGVERLIDYIHKKKNLAEFAENIPEMPTLTLLA